MDRTAEFLRLDAEGHSTAELASMLHVTPRTITRWRRRHGVAKGAPSQPMTAAELAQAAALLSDGCSGAEVARTIGRSAVAVRRRFPGLVWTKAQAAQFARMPELLSSLSIGGTNL